MVDFEQLLVGLVTSYRYVGDEINPKLAQTEAEILHDAVKEKKGSYEETIRVLTTRSRTQLVATFNRYREIHGTSISKVQKKGHTTPFYFLFTDDQIVIIVLCICHSKVI